MLMMKASFVVAVPLALTLGLVAVVGSVATAQTDPRIGSWNATTTTYSAKYDGKDYPISGNPLFDTIALKRTNASPIEATLKKNGTVVQTSRTVMSKDGKMMTVTAKGTDASGKSVNNVSVFDKQ